MTDNLILDFDDEPLALATLNGELHRIDWSVIWVEIKLHIRRLALSGYLIKPIDTKIFVNCIVHESVHLLINQALGRDDLWEWHSKSHFIMNTGLDGFVPEEFPTAVNEKSSEFYHKYVQELP